MAGHSHWKQIKEQKGVTDKKRGAAFSKLLKAVAAAAKSEPNPQFNPRLRTAIETARAEGVPNDNIERAISRARGEGAVEEVVMEAYGPGGSALIIAGITDNTNRTVNEIKALLRDAGAKWADPGSVRWAFEEIRSPEGVVWKPKFPQALSSEDAASLRALVEAISRHDDIQHVFSNPPETL